MHSKSRRPFGVGYVDEGIHIAEGYVDEGIHIADPYVVLASGSLTRPDGLAYANLADLSKTGYVDESRLQRCSRFWCSSVSDVLNVHS